MWRKIKKFTALTQVEKQLFIEAYITLLVMRVALFTLSFKRLIRTLEHSSGKVSPPTSNSGDLDLAQAIGRAIRSASAYTPWESACLVQALSAQRMLQKRGIPGVFYLGAAKVKEGEEKMHAHAWLQCGHRIVTGAEGHEKYTVLSSVVWNK